MAKATIGLKDLSAVENIHLARQIIIKSNHSTVSGTGP